MTLNLTSYSTVPAWFRSEDDFGSNVWAMCSENRGNHCWLSDPFGHGGGRDWPDPIDLLPADPFGMELTSDLAAVIVCCIEDLLEANSCDYQLYSWNDDYGDNPGRWLSDDFFGDFDLGVQYDSLEPVVGVEENSNLSRPEEGLPHEGLVLSLGYLGVQDLLSVERVCRSLHSAVQNDPLLWRCIHIDSMLSEKMTDDALLRLTLRSQGSLQCLSLVGCSKITDEGLKKVLESNPMLQKLSVYGCLRLSMEGLISNLKAFKSSGAAGITQLKLGRLFSVSSEQYEELQTLLVGDEMRQPKPSNRRFYRCGVSSIACEDDRVLDIEVCPGCQKFKLVFDCPSESCQAKGPENCRACEVCIGRCVQCGRCVNDCTYVETFFLDYLCLACLEASTLELQRTNEITCTCFSFQAMASHGLDNEI